MAKLKKREIIILAITFIVILYGAYSWLSDAKSEKYTKENSSTDKYTGSITGDLIKNPSNMADAYIVGRAEAEWVKNPFWKNGSYKEWASRENSKTSDEPALKIIYSGFVDTGKKKMAIINGLEYSIGEKIEVDGYILKKISSTRIVVGNKKSGSDLIISIQE